jgi:hypothetical protein
MKQQEKRNKTGTLGAEESIEADETAGTVGAEKQQEQENR